MMIRTSLVKKMIEFTLDEVMAIDGTFRNDPHSVHHPRKRQAVKKHVIKRLYEHFGFKAEARN